MTQAVVNPVRSWCRQSRTHTSKAKALPECPALSGEQVERVPNDEGCRHRPRHHLQVRLLKNDALYMHYLVGQTITSCNGGGRRMPPLYWQCRPSKAVPALARHCLGTNARQPNSSTYSLHTRLSGPHPACGVLHSVSIHSLHFHSVIFTQSDCTQPRVTAALTKDWAIGYTSVLRVDGGQ